MLKITVSDVLGFDGTYDLDVSYFTNNELHMIKKTAEVRAGELQDALAAGDNDVIVAFTQIAILRSGKTIDPDLLWNAKTGAITVENIDDEVEDDLSALPPPSDAASSTTGGSSSSSSGASSSSISESLDLDLSRSGSPG